MMHKFQVNKSWCKSIEIGQKSHLIAIHQLLNKSWEECETLYLKAYELDKSRPESLYFIGIHHYMNKDMLKAYEFMNSKENVIN